LVLRQDPCAEELGDECIPIFSFFNDQDLGLLDTRLVKFFKEDGLWCPCPELDASLERASAIAFSALGTCWTE
jgi:hypothetical protein